MSIAGFLLAGFYIAGFLAGAFRWVFRDALTNFEHNVDMNSSILVKSSYFFKLPIYLAWICATSTHGLQESTSLQIETSSSRVPNCVPFPVVSKR